MNESGFADVQKVDGELEKKPDAALGWDPRHQAGSSVSVQSVGSSLGFMVELQ